MAIARVMGGEGAPPSDTPAEAPGPVDSAAPGGSPFAYGAEALLSERLKWGSKLHTKLLPRLIARRDLAEKNVSQRYDEWDRVDEKRRLFLDFSRPARLGDKTSDRSKKENPYKRGIVIPASFAAAEVRKTQACSLIWFRDPFIQYGGTDPDDIAAAENMETMVEYDMQQTNYRLKTYGLFQDADAYGRGIIYDTWQTQQGWKRPSLPADIRKQMRARGMELPREWATIKEGNDWDNIDPYSFFPDPRVPIARVQQGEFCGHRAYRSYLWLLERQMDEDGESGIYFNLDRIKDWKSQPGAKGLGGRARWKVEDFALTGSADDRDNGIHAIDHMQLRLIPKEWELGPETMPMLYWFSWANDDAIIRAHENPYEHGEFTYAVGEVHPDMHAVANPGSIELMDGLQRVIDWSFNSRVENIRRVINNQGIYLPSLIEEEDLLNPGAGMHIRLSEEGERLVKAGLLSPNQIFQQLNIADVTAPHGELQGIAFEMLQRLSAAGDNAMGQPLKSQRTLGEVQSVNSGSSQRLAITMQLIDAMAITPLATRASANRQQFTTLERYYRLVGDRARQDGPDRIPLGRDDIEGNFDYQGQSGVMPSDPVRDAQTWALIWQTISSAPVLTQPGPDGKFIDPRKVFNELARRSGVRNIDQFYTVMPQMPMAAAAAGLPPGVIPQVVPDEAIDRGLESGNMAPLPMGGA